MPAMLARSESCTRGRCRGGDHGELITCHLPTTHRSHPTVQEGHEDLDQDCPRFGRDVLNTAAVAGARYQARQAQLREADAEQWALRCCLFELLITVRIHPPKTRMQMLERLGRHLCPLMVVLHLGGWPREVRTFMAIDWSRTNGELVEQGFRHAARITHEAGRQRPTWSISV